VRLSKSRLRLVVIGGLVLAGSASAAAVALAGRGTPHRARPLFVTRFVHTAPLSHYRPAVHGRVMGGSPIERAAAAQAIRDFGTANRILRIEFTTAPAAANLPPSAVWVSVEVSTPDKPGVVFSAWQGLLAVSAIVDADRGGGAAPVAGKVVRLVFPSGETFDVADSVNEPLDATSDVPPASAQALNGGIAAEARQEGLKIVEQGSFDIGGRPAVYAVLVTNDPAGFAHETGARMFALQRGVLNAPFAAAGSYIEVRDSAGGVVEIGGGASRLQQGLGWSNPALGPPSEFLSP
jgi:hypothetical protein